MLNNQNNSRLEVINSIEGFVNENLSTLLKPVEESWQPSDFLPDMTKENWREDIHEFREIWLQKKHYQLIKPG